MSALLSVAALPFLKPPPPINLGGIPIQVFGMIVAAGVLIGAAILRRGVRATQSALRRYGLLAGFLAVWQIGSTQGWINPTVFPPLDAILSALWQGLTSGALLDDGPGITRQRRPDCPTRRPHGFPQRPPEPGR